MSLIFCSKLPGKDSGREEKYNRLPQKIGMLGFFEFFPRILKETNIPNSETLVSKTGNLGNLHWVDSVK
jgi:hypothetical protein